MRPSESQATAANAADRGVVVSLPGVSRELLDDRDLEREYRLKRKTWQNMRIAGTGPVYMKTGDSKRARCLYRRDDVEAWLAARRVEPRR